MNIYHHKTNIFANPKQYNMQHNMLMGIKAAQHAHGNHSDERNELLHVSTLYR